MNRLRFGLILIVVVSLDQVLAVHRIAAPRSKRALNYNVFELDSEVETVKEVAKSETKVRKKRFVAIVAETLARLLIGGLLKLIPQDRAVVIINYTGGWLWVSCASGDDQIGGRWIWDRNVLAWKFRPNFWGTTLFYCDFFWNGKHRRVDVWKTGLANPYGTIKWNVFGRVKGPQIRSDHGQSFYWQ